MVSKLKQLIAEGKHSNVSKSVLYNAKHWNTIKFHRKLTFPSFVTFSGHIRSFSGSNLVRMKLTISTEHTVIKLWFWSISPIRNSEKLTMITLVIAWRFLLLNFNSKLIKCKIIIFECRHVTLVSSEIRRMINEPETKCPSLISMTSRFGPFQPLSRSVFTGLYRGAEDLYHFIFVATGSRPEVD